MFPDILMQVHVPTLMYLMSGLMGLGSAAMALEWRKWREPAMLWWIAGLCSGAAGSAMTTLRAFGWNDIAVGGAGAAIVLGYALMSKGAAVFAGRRWPRAYVAAGPLLWLTLWCAFWRTLDIETAAGLRMAIVSILAATFSLASGWFLVKMKGSLATPRLLGWVYILHSTMFVLRAATVSLPGFIESSRLLTGSTFTIFVFETVLFVCTSSYLAIMLVRERGEQRLQTASDTDFLTGIDNRRAFFRKATLVLSRANSGSAGAGAVLVLFDLDHFKAINDRFGHAFGDEMLKFFCQVVGEHLQSGDVFGRLGGEEFAIAMPHEDEASARLRVEALCSAYRLQAAQRYDFVQTATVSAGIAFMYFGRSIDDLLECADRALYRAKHLGRDRVEIEIFRGVDKLISAVRADLLEERRTGLMSEPQRRGQDRAVL